MLVNDRHLPSSDYIFYHILRPCGKGCICLYVYVYILFV